MGWFLVYAEGRCLKQLCPCVQEGSSRWGCGSAPLPILRTLRVCGCLTQASLRQPGAACELGLPPAAQYFCKLELASISKLVLDSQHQQQPSLSLCQQGKVLGLKAQQCQSPRRSRNPAPR